MSTGNIDPIVAELAALRRELGIAQTVLSARCGFSASQIAQYETGRKVPDVARLRRWAFGLGAVLRIDTGAES